MARASDPAPVDIASKAPGGVTVQYRRGDGRVVDAGLDRLPADEVPAGLPVREFRSWRGRKHYSGWYSLNKAPDLAQHDNPRLPRRDRHPAGIRPGPSSSREPRVAEQPGRAQWLASSESGPATAPLVSMAKISAE